MTTEPENLRRFCRQTAFAPLGLDGQRALSRSRVLIVGVGGLGSWNAELLARAGVGMLRLVDDDRVELANVHRQALYDELDAASSVPKVQAAATRLRKINGDVMVEPVQARLGKDNVAELAASMDLVLDGSDNFVARFIINDYCVRQALPWILAGVIGAEAQTMTILPGGRPCLRCIYDQPAPPCVDPSCRAAGVLGPAVSAIASIQALEAIKILSGHADQASPYLTKMDLWANTFQRIDARAACAAVDCPCCRRGHFEFLEC